MLRPTLRLKALLVIMLLAAIFWCVILWVV